MFYPGRRQAVTLHFVWDSLLVRDLIGKQKIAEVAARFLQANMQDERQCPSGTLEAWANEAHGPCP